MLRTEFKLPSRRTEGMLASILTLMDLTISAPDHTTVSRRAVNLRTIRPSAVPYGTLRVLIDSTGPEIYGAGQPPEAKHGAKSRRKWRKLHLAVDADSGMIVAQTLTDQDADDPSQVALLLDQIDGQIVRVTADDAMMAIPLTRRSGRMTITLRWCFLRARRSFPETNQVCPHSVTATWR